MPRIEIETIIENASLETVFDISRSIDVHIESTEGTNERAIAGVTSGLVELNDEITWRAKHLGVYQNLTSKITGFDRPIFFADEMLKGAFKGFRHEHFFSKHNDKDVLVKDVFDYTSPLDVLGKLADILFLEKYMTRFLVTRNACIKRIVESGDWKKYL